MTSDPQPRVRTFHCAPADSDRVVTTCIIHSASGHPHAVDITIKQAKALSLELSRAILAYELTMDDPQPVRLAAANVIAVPLTELGIDVPDAAYDVR